MKNTKDISIRKNNQGKKTIICNLEKTNLQIFNQWGEKIYDSAGLTIGGIALIKASAQ